MSVSSSRDARCSATATRLAVTNSRHAGYWVVGSADVVLQDCSANSCGGHGVHCEGPGSKVHAEGCTFQSNGGYGVLAEGEAEVTVKGCHSSQHCRAAGYRAAAASGYRAANIGARMEVSDSVSEGDRQGCSVDAVGQLTTEKFTLDGTLYSARSVWKFQ